MFIREQPTIIQRLGLTANTLPRKHLAGWKLDLNAHSDHPALFAKRTHLAGCGLDLAEYADRFAP